jgi:hypothetical protein
MGFTQRGDTAGSKCPTEMLSRASGAVHRNEKAPPEKAGRVILAKGTAEAGADLTVSGASSAVHRNEKAPQPGEASQDMEDGTPTEVSGP